MWCFHVRYRENLTMTFTWKTAYNYTAFFCISRREATFGSVAVMPRPRHILSNKNVAHARGCHASRRHHGLLFVLRGIWFINHLIMIVFWLVTAVRSSSSITSATHWEPSAREEECCVFTFPMRRIFSDNTSRSRRNLMRIIWWGNFIHYIIMLSAGDLAKIQNFFI